MPRDRQGRRLPYPGEPGYSGSTGTPRKRRRNRAAKSQKRAGRIQDRADRASGPRKEKIQARADRAQNRANRIAADLPTAAPQPRPAPMTRPTPAPPVIAPERPVAAPPLEIQPTGGPQAIEELPVSSQPPIFTTGMPQGVPTGGPGALAPNPPGGPMGVKPPEGVLPTSGQPRFPGTAPGGGGFRPQPISRPTPAFGGPATDRGRLADAALNRLGGAFQRPFNLRGGGRF